MADKLKKSSIKQHFRDMDYNNIMQEKDQLKVWLPYNSRFFAFIEKEDEEPNGKALEVLSLVGEKKILFTVYSPEVSTVENILTKCGVSEKKWADTHFIERSKKINSLSKEIEVYKQQIIEIDIFSRGILRKDTVNSVSVLTQHLRYYANFSYLQNQEHTVWKPEGLVVAVIPDDSPLYVFGLVLGPALASGCNIILQTSARITRVADLIIDCAKRARIPSGTIRLIPGDVEIETFLVNKHVSVITCMDNLYADKYNVCNPFNKHIISFGTQKIPMIVFENSDLDSACHTLVQSAWSHHGTLHHSIGEVLVQENVFQKFLDTLKSTIRNIKTGPANDNQADVSSSLLPVILEDYKKALLDAADIGLEVFKNSNEGTDFMPTILIGGKLYPNNVIKESRNIPLVTVVAFRTANEAVSLANNSRQGYGASIWSENISLVHELARTLQVTNLWVNCCGIVSPDIPFSPYKSNGCSYFGGKEGLQEYVKIGLPSPTGSVQLVSDYSLHNLEMEISAAKRGQLNWSKLTFLNRAEKLRRVVDGLFEQRKIISDVQRAKWLDSWIQTLYEASCGISKKAYTPSNPSYSVNSFREPRGIIAIELKEDITTHLKKLVAGAIVEGNAVLLLDSSKDSFYCDLSRMLQFDVCKIIPYSDSIAKAVALDKEISVYFTETTNKIFSSFSLRDAKKLCSAFDDWEDVVRKVTLIKHMWVPVGQSFL